MRVWWGDLALAVGVLLLLGFPVAARVVADGEPVAVAAGVRLPALPALSVRASSARVRGLPVFLAIPAGDVARIVAGGTGAERRAVDSRLVSAYGRRRAARLENELDGFGVPRVVRLPRRPVVAENDLAALLVVAGAASTSGQGQSQSAFLNAGAFALALLQQAVAASGGCVPELNLAFLEGASAAVVSGPGVEPAYQKAAAACSADPTALWALGEYQSELLDVTTRPGQFAEPAGSPLAPFVTFRRLQREFPGVAAGWAGAGDTALRIAYQLQGGEPFTAREWFSWARVDYARAVRLQADYQNRAGLARAQAGLGEFADAIQTQRRALQGYPSSADLQARLLDYLQRAHRFAQAALVAGRLAAVHRFPAGVELYAGGGADTDEDASGPLSTGVGQMQPATITTDLARANTIQQQVKAATTSNLPFLPVYAPMAGVGGSARWCPDWSRRVDLVLSHQPAAALAGYSAGLLDDLRPGVADCARVSIGNPEDLAGVAELELGRVAAAVRVAGRGSLSRLEDLRQNLWRYAGDYSYAAEAAQQWAALRPGNPVAVEREGEIAFLRHRYGEAATDFAIVVARARLGHRYPSMAEVLGLLDQGTVLAKGGRVAEALTTLADASEAAETIGDSADAGQALEQAGDAELASRHLRQAAQDYAVAASLGNGDDTLENNGAIAEMATGDPAGAATRAAAAIAADPGDPIFWWTAGQAQQFAGQRAIAIADYRRALALDPTLYPVANNLGVLLMKRGDDGAAAAALRRAVGANRVYATGWFNLGVALEREGPLHVVASEGCLARARALDGSLASRGPVPLLDNTTYQSHLDLSKPLPANWTFVSSQNRTSVTAAGLSAILVLALGLARSLGARVGAPGGAQKWFDVIAALQRRAPTVYTLHPPAVGILATLAFLLWPLHSGPTDGWAATLVFALGIIVLIAVVLRVRLLAATRSHVKLREQTWPPALAFGLVLTVVGAGWAPLPVARTPREAPRVHWAGPAVVAALAIALLVLATWLQVPLTRSLGAAGLVMAASLLTPIPPLDGATVSSTAVGALPTLAVLGAAVLMAVGLL